VSISMYVKNPIRKRPRHVLNLDFAFRRNEGVVGKVQNQKQCMGCWAFSIVGVMESMIAIKGGGLPKLSTQVNYSIHPVNVSHKSKYFIKRPKRNTEYMHYNSCLIPDEVAEASEIFLRDAHVFFL
jgi:hypothetical protein